MEAIIMNGLIDLHMILVRYVSSNVEPPRSSKQG